MSDHIEIKFKGERKNVFANPLQFPFKLGDYAVVEAEKGEDIGVVNNLDATLPTEEKDRSKVFKIVRKALVDDILKHKQNQVNESRAIETCRQKVVKHKLNMKLVDSEFQFDSKKITFYFTAEKRVDFRELVKDLAAEYRTRIELRQIGVRDESKRLGGYGVCGRKLCCSSWIKSFQPITTQAAKDQNLPLNPNKLAGVCGRLKCCLMYERDFYNWAVTKFPALAKQLKTEKGTATVERIDILKESVLVRYASNEFETLPLSEIKDKFKCDHDDGNGCGFKASEMIKKDS
ncbi:MAG: hypothetical protein DWQ05_03780 [Calditrichaeota bacterium]|nr:MAG: hypothetical protein DWQ05_03780 [Calditrichota bacterium]